MSTPPAMPQSISPSAMRLRQLHRRGEAGAAGALHVVGGRLGMQPAAERRLAREVPVARVLDHRARGDLADFLVFQVEARNKAFRAAVSMCWFVASL